jgi:hypothetical protein
MEHGRRTGRGLDHPSYVLGRSRLARLDPSYKLDDL